MQDKSLKQIEHGLWRVYLCMCWAARWSVQRLGEAAFTGPRTWSLHAVYASTQRSNQRAIGSSECLTPFAAAVEGGR